MSDREEVANFSAKETRLNAETIPYESVCPPPLRLSSTGERVFLTPDYGWGFRKESVGRFRLRIRKLISLKNP